MIDFVDLMEPRSLIIEQDDQEKFWYSDQWIMEPTYHGIRYQGLVYAPRKIKFHGKKKEYKLQNKFEKLNNIIDSINLSNLPEQTLFEGYLTFNNDKTKAFRFIKLDDIDDELVSIAKFFITDIIYYSGKDYFNMTLFDRLSLLSKIFIETDNVKMQPKYSSNKKNVYCSLKDRVNVFVFKDLISMYTFKPTLSWRIYTIPYSYFMVIMDVVESNIVKFKNMAVSIKGGLLKNGKLVHIMNIPIHNNEDRINLFKNRERLKGKVFEFLASEKSEKTEKYQEARFLKVREDLDFNSCIY